ncbi:RecB family exonuclease [Pseudactinotalea terrae]|uniref:RecB family exonuclease n=1 Tax=Pseudactinotalea terrae TaxID=1743262 RepID=UPI0012E14C4C|nr:PD-(D/E)XK nuclease family protein [Pseudactinotalea terrae]
MTPDSANFYLGDKLAWVGHHLVVTDPDLLAKLDKPYLSASTAKSVHNCPACWVGAKALPGSFDLFSPTEKGSAAHLVLEELFQLPPGRRDAKHAAAILTGLPRRDPEEGEVDYAQALGTDPVRYAQWISMVTNAYSGIFTIEDPTQVEVFATELRLDGIEVGGVPFKGFIDRVDIIEQDGNRALFVRDYKTGADKSEPNPRFSDDHGDQIRLYVEALRRWLTENGEPNLQVAGGGLYYVEHGTQREVDIRPSAIRQTLAGFATSWRELHSSLESASFEVKPSPLCGWCPLVNSCPVASPKRNPKDPRDNAPQAVELGIPVLRRNPVTAVPAGDEITAPAAHTAVGRNGSGTSDMEDTMSNGKPWRETKPWEGDTVDGHIMLASPAATAVIGLASMSAEQLHQHGFKVGPTTLRLMTSLLAKVVLDTQATITDGSTDWAQGANTRARGALHTVLTLRPLPFGDLPEGTERDAEDFAAHAEALLAWQQRATTFAAALLRTGIDLFDGHLPLNFTDLLPARGQGRDAA